MTCRLSRRDPEAPSMHSRFLLLCVVLFPLSLVHASIPRDTARCCLARSRLSPVGAVVSVSGSKPEICTFGFQSKYYDPETELYCFG